MVEGCFFGEIEIMENTPRKHFALADSICNIYFCNKDAFLDLVKDFPLVEKEVNEIIKRRK